MLAAGIIVGWVAYAVGSYGYILLRGYDIPFRSWISPLNPYQWPAGGPGPIPDSQLFPGQATAGSGSGSGSAGGGGGTPRAHILNPGAANRTAQQDFGKGGAGHPLPQ